jgi:hypothetical protein
VGLTYSHLHYEHPGVEEEHASLCSGIWATLEHEKTIQGKTYVLAHEALQSLNFYADTLKINLESEELFAHLKIPDLRLGALGSNVSVMENFHLIRLLMSAFQMVNPKHIPLLRPPRHFDVELTKAYGQDIRITDLLPFVGQTEVGLIFQYCLPGCDARPAGREFYAKIFETQMGTRFELLSRAELRRVKGPEVTVQIPSSVMQDPLYDHANCHVMVDEGAHHYSDLSIRNVDPIVKRRTDPVMFHLYQERLDGPGFPYHPFLVGIYRYVFDLIEP